MANFTEYQRAIIIGSILGDGCLEFNGHRGTRLQIKQAKERKEYIFWLYDKLKTICKSGPRQRRDNQQWYFSTKSILELTDLWKKFYKDGTKKIPRDFGRMLVSPISLGIWYMDDGTLDWRPKDHYAFSLAVNCFSSKETKRLSEVLFRNFGITSSVQNPLCRGKRYSRLYIGAKGRDKFLMLIKSYILKCFSYKLPPFITNPSET